MCTTIPVSIRQSFQSARIVISPNSTLAPAAAPALAFTALLADVGFPDPGATVASSALGLGILTSREVPTTTGGPVGLVGVASEKGNGSGVIQP